MTLARPLALSPAWMLALLAATPAIDAQLGTAETLVLDTQPGADDGRPFPRTALGDRLIFSGLDVAGMESVWISDGTAATTTRLIDFPSGTGIPADFANLGDQVIWVAGNKLYRTDGTPEGSHEFFDIASLGFTIDYVLWIHPLGDSGRGVVCVREHFQDMHLIVTDGTAANTVDYRQISNAQYPASIGGKIWFSGTENFGGDMEPWVTDGTDAGTYEVVDIEQYASQPTDFTQVGDEVWFSAAGAVYRSDGTAAGTSMIADTYGTPTDFTVLDDGTVVFVSGLTRGEMWRSDGTEAGTYQISFIDQGIWGAVLKTEVVAAGPYAYFVADPVTSEYELWRTDGSTGGTFHVSDLDHWGIYGLGAATTDGRFVFPFNDGSGSGTELLVTEGTPATTQILADVWAGSGGSNPEYFRRVGANIYFAADDGVTGKELHAVTIPETGGWIASTYANGCGSAVAPRMTWSGAPTLGDSFGIGVDGSPTALTHLFLSADPDFQELTSDCAGLVKSPLFVGTFVTDGAGDGEAVFGIPNLPPLVGLPFYFQAAHDTGVGAFGGLDLTNGLEVILGL